MENILYILLAVVILLLMVIVHELGHYVAGKILKFKINEFSVGFGPKIFSKRNKKTGEVFSLRVIPLGGYCAFEGEEGEEDKDKPRIPVESEIFDELLPGGDGALELDGEQIAEIPDTQNVDSGIVPFPKQAPWKRIIVLLSGALFNFLSAIIFSFLFILVVGYNIPQVGALTSNGIDGYYCPQLQVGDVIVAVNGQEIGIMDSFDSLVSDKSEGSEYVLTVERNGVETEVKVTVKHIVSGDDDYYGFGFSSMYVQRGAGNVGYALKYCLPFTFYLSFMVLSSLWGLITGSVALTSVTGPVGTITFMAQTTAQNWRNIFLLLPLLAANLAIFNILPIPALDGSKIVFTIIEWIRKKPIDPKIENTIHSVGLIALLAFVVIIDIIGILL